MNIWNKAHKICVELESRIKYWRQWDMYDEHGWIKAQMKNMMKMIYDFSVGHDVWSPSYREGGKIWAAGESCTSTWAGSWWSVVLEPWEFDTKSCRWASKIWTLVFTLRGWPYKETDPWRSFMVLVSKFWKGTSPGQREPINSSEKMLESTYQATIICEKWIAF